MCVTCLFYCCTIATGLKPYYSLTNIYIILSDLRIVGPKRSGVTGRWKKLHNEELHNLYTSPSIIRIIKSRRMRWAGHVARMEEKRNV
jgi:hypothetical protein